MKKIELKSSDLSPGKFRLIINPTEDYSVGIIISKSELNLIKNEIEEILEKEKEKRD